MTSGPSLMELPSLQATDAVVTATMEFAEKRKRCLSMTKMIDDWTILKNGIS